MALKKLSVIILLAGILLTACVKEPPVPVEKLFINGVIYTANQTQQVVTSIGITQDRLLYVGHAQDAKAVISSDTEIIDLKGKMVIPGLHDVHIHLPGIVETDNCDLAGQPFSLTDMIPRLQQCISRLNLLEGEWLTVAQWSYYTGNAPSETFPTIRSALDKVSQTHPIVLLADDGHHGAVNSFAMSLATDKKGLNIGLSKTTLNNEFAHLKALIGVDNTGEPNGVINEDARKIVNLPNLWGYPEIDLTIYNKIAQRLAASGITSVMDAALRADEIANFAKWAAQSPLTYRMTAAFYADFDDYRPNADQPISVDALMADLTAIQQRHEGVLNLKIDTAKIFVDGVIEGDPYSFPPMLPNAASLNNYLQPIFAIDSESEILSVVGYVDTDSDICVAVREKGAQSVSGSFDQSFLAEHGFLASQCFESNGILEREYEFIYHYTLALHAAGVNIHSHAIGDRAVRVALDTFEAAREANPDSDANFSIAHAQIIHPDDILRIADLDVAIAFTYSWIEPTTEYQMYVTPFIEPTFSEEDLYDPLGYVYKNTYPAASVLKAGGILVAGSDAPVEERDPRPMLNIEKAVTRTNDTTGRIFNVDERVSVRDTLDAYTIKGAQMLEQDNITGSLEVGKKADFVILDQDLLTLEAGGNSHRISDTKILSTWFDGREIYSMPDEKN
jgi:predicted amidohydrolase YtcJ|tara:strand:+ start:3491 stop:5515 length:2025 start_codon:yes stop_codon:yes gene_type:complete